MSIHNSRSEGIAIQQLGHQWHNENGGGRKLTGLPGRRELRGIRSQLSPALDVWSRIAGLPMIHPS